MNQLTIIIAVVTLISAIETGSQSVLKYAFDNPRLKYIGILGPIGYTIICYVLYRMYAFEGMALINAWWNVATSITVTMAGVLLFGESLKHSDYMGIVMVVLGSIFLSLDDLGLG